MDNSPTFEFHVSRQARERYRLAAALFSSTGNVVFANLVASREFAKRINDIRDAQNHPERALHPGALNAMGLIDEALHLLVARYREQRDARALQDALTWFEARLGRPAVDRTLLAFTEEFPPAPVYSGKQSAAEWLRDSSGGVPHRAVALEELIMLWLANSNPAFRRFDELFDDAALENSTAYPTIINALREYFNTRPRFGPENQNLVDLLRAPALASPDSLSGQLAFIREKWSGLLGDFVARMLTALDVLQEEEIAVWMRFHPPGAHFGPWQTGDSSIAAIPSFAGAAYEYERFSPDVEWMPRTVMIAKSVYVWLHQLAAWYRRDIRTLDQVPNEELDLLARHGFNGLWLIGVWQRGQASQRIKQMMGNPEAAPSAYSLYDYTIAADLGGEAAYHNLRDRAWARGIRMASDMVPNHMAIDSRWVIEHPDWFLSLGHKPFPSYSYHGPDLSSDGRVEIKIEDHYYDRTDAAVTFRRVDRWTGDARYVYHGNDGTSFPWNDTAQLNYLRAEVREAVIQTILHVARLFPIIRFDAAMTLTKQHYQRLWFPAPGTGGAIPSRAEHGMTKERFDRAMPEEFWREVVDRVAAEVPDTLLVAEAFWLLEGFFVRTLGMHRVYNSAFMNMLRDEENANYRTVLKNTLEFDPEVLKRYVNFMNNPDERTAVDQFGKGDKYFGVCTLMATLPGLPMFGHGQIEGFTERYGMEYRRAYHDEQPDVWLVARHEREIAPLLHRRGIFAEVREFLLYDFYADAGTVNEDVFAYSNRRGEERALVLYHNRYASTAGWIRVSAAYCEKTPDGKRLRQRTLGDSFGFSADPAMLAMCRDAVTGLEYLYRSRDLTDKGLRVELGAYQHRVLLDWRDIRDDGVRPWTELCESLAGGGVSSLADEMRGLELKPVHDALRALIEPEFMREIAEHAVHGDSQPPKLEVLLEDGGRRVRTLLESVRTLASTECGKDVGLEPFSGWHGDVEVAERHFRTCLAGALRIPALERQFLEPWPPEARVVLPTAASLSADTVRIWGTVLGWCSLQSLGWLRRPAEPERAGVALFDRLRLREPMARAFELLGYQGEERWRAVARVRAALAHGSWAPQAEPAHAAAPYSMVLDPDVAWLIGVHEHEGVRYFVKESFEGLLWFMAVMSVVATGEEPAADRVRNLEARLRGQLRAAADAGYQVETLLDRTP